MLADVDLPGFCLSGADVPLPFAWESWPLTLPSSSSGFDNPPLPFLFTSLRQWTELLSVDITSG